MAFPILVSGINVYNSDTMLLGESMTQVGPNFRMNGIKFAVYQCECETYFVANTYAARRKGVCSCGCRINTMRPEERRRGMRFSKWPEYVCWRAMTNRCTNPTDTAYSYYGGRGIKVCQEWLGRGGFLKWYEHIGAMPSPGMTQDRMDVNGNYEPGNVKWSTRLEQSRNTRERKCRQITAFGKTQSLSKWSKEVGLNITCISERIRRGWSPEKALSVMDTTNRKK